MVVVGGGGVGGRVGDGTQWLAGGGTARGDEDLVGG